LVFLLVNTFQLLGYAIFCLWEYLMNVISETLHAH
jgi:hypothetical protein